MEHHFIDQLTRSLPAHPLLQLGIGDDAAVLRFAQQADCVIAADLLADGTHFNAASDDLTRIGRKALAVNLSDLAAMAAEPVAAVISLLLPQNEALQTATKLYEGLLPLAEEFQVAVAGGDTNCWQGGLAINVTIIGQASKHGVLRRSGARPGDAILATGEFGGSRLGKQFEFTPLVRESLWLHQHCELHAGIDVSDGLALDLARICAASGCGAWVDRSQIPVAAAAHEWALANGNTQTPLEHALADGEDFELLLAVPIDSADEVMSQAQSELSLAVTQIGQFIETPGLWTGDKHIPQPLKVTGFEHGS